jgi:cold shock CspA family protein
MIGKIESWGTAKGYGFICDDSGKSYFCHITALENYSGENTEPPRRGQEVMFDIERSSRTGRTQACHVILL